MPKDEFDLDDPLELNGVAFPTEEDTSEAMCECLVEEYMRMGYNAKQILLLFRTPQYLGLHMVWEARGEAFVREQIAVVFARWGRPVHWAAEQGSVGSAIAPSPGPAVAASLPVQPDMSSHPQPSLS